MLLPPASLLTHALSSKEASAGSARSPSSAHHALDLYRSPGLITGFPVSFESETGILFNVPAPARVSRKNCPSAEQHEYSLHKEDVTGI